MIVEENLGLLEIIAVLTRDQLKDLAKEIFIDERILHESGKNDDNAFDQGVEFERVDGEEEQTTTGNVVDKRNKKQHGRENVPVETSDDVDVDNI